MNGDPATTQVLRVGRPGTGFPCREQAVTTLIVRRRDQLAMTLTDGSAIAAAALPRALSGAATAMS
ncbi:MULTISPECIES: hypothetical protein [unclassified Variovorax]|uniref:hypothetical protein n=1 Tax=unclassified Variovorax TaxID=663243 RepID=UPI003ED0B2E4